MTQIANQNRQRLICLVCVSFYRKHRRSAVMTSPQECASHKCLLHPSPERRGEKHRNTWCRAPVLLHGCEMPGAIQSPPRLQPRPNSSFVCWLFTRPLPAYRRKSKVYTEGCPSSSTKVPVSR